MSVTTSAANLCDNLATVNYSNEHIPNVVVDFPKKETTKTYIQANTRSVSNSISSKTTEEETQRMNL